MEDRQAFIDMLPYLECREKRIDLSRPRVMGILNITPDSFSDGGIYRKPDEARRYAHLMVEEGADIVDIGGESTRPGASPVDEAEEIRRVIPMISILAKEIGVPISVDTSKPGVMIAAADAGAGMINDVMALQAPGAIDAALNSKLPVCLLHMQGKPATMQISPQYTDVLKEVRDFFIDRITVCTKAGISRNLLLLDPGFGFGKTLEHNLQLLKGLASFRDLGCPLIVGLSRKSMIGALLGGMAIGGRLYGSLAASIVAVLAGASIVRTHDVKATVDALRVVSALLY